MSKCIIFSRVSTDKQTLETQINALKAQALSLGYSDDRQVLIQFKESGIELSSNERAGINQLKDIIEQDKSIDTVLIWELSRIGRRADVIYEVRDFLIQHQIRWIVLQPLMEILSEGGKLNTTSNLMLAIFVSFVENEMQIKKQRFKRGKESNKEKGLYVGGPIIYGYKVIDKHYTIDEAQAAIVKYVFDEVTINHRSAHSVAKEFYETAKLGMLTLMQCRSKVKHILGKKEYCGTRQYPQIVSEEQFETARKLLSSRKVGTNHACTHVYFCQGIVFDGNTGHALTPQWNDSLYTNDYKPVSSIGINLLDSVVFSLAHRHLAAHGSVSKNEAMKRMKQEMIILNKKRNASNRRLSELKDKIEKIEMRFIDGKISEKLANELEAKIEDEAKEQSRLIKHYDDKIQECINTINIYKNDIAKVTFNEMLTDKDKREIVQTAIKRIDVRRIDASICEVEIKYDDLSVETYLMNSRNRKVFDSLGNPVEYVFERRICRENKIRKPNIN